MSKQLTQYKKEIQALTKKLNTKIKKLKKSMAKNNESRNIVIHTKPFK